VSFEQGPRIEIQEHGPLRVFGAGLVRMRPATDQEGSRVEWERSPELEHGDDFDLCRCGLSRNKPFCDGSEVEAGFDGTETADRLPTADRRQLFGSGGVILGDDRSLCSKARFCVRRDMDAWELAEEPSLPGREEKLRAMVHRCPSGRLVYITLPGGSESEPELPPEIGIIDDGPLWVRGRIPVESADGFRYEVRNRVTLCRCGQSKNKPFCDGSHVAAGFRDGSHVAAGFRDADERTPQRKDA
jgi:CDGSH-type Zn-finger protein